jgi:hypothetical protein
MQVFWGDTAYRLVNNTEVSQVLEILFVFAPMTYTLGKCGVVRTDVGMLQLVAWYPQVTTFEELHCLHFRGQAVQEELDCMTLRMKAEIS